jgi:hypothetical protein
MMSIEAAQLVKEAQQEVFVSNGQMAPLTLQETKQDFDAALAWLDQHAPAMRDYVQVLRDQDQSKTEQPLDWIDTSWSNGTNFPNTIEAMAGGAAALVRRGEETNRKR